MRKSFINSKDNLSSNLSSGHQKPAKKSAFSLLEISMVILIIAALVIGVVAGKRI